MEAFTYSKARQNLSRVLEIALRQGEVKIRRRDGTSFVIKPERERKSKSPLEIKGVQAKGISKEEILKSIRDTRREY